MSILGHLPHADVLKDNRKNQYKNPGDQERDACHKDVVHVPVLSIASTTREEHIVPEVVLGPHDLCLGVDAVENQRA
jgi:hypothetical protein